MTSRILPFSEWERLPEELDPILMGLTPGTSRICVVEDEGRIIGRWLVFPVLHAECIEIDASYRRSGGVARRLLRLMKQAAQSLGFDRVWTASASEDVTKLLSHPRLGAVPIAALSFVLPVGKEESCRQL